METNAPKCKLMNSSYLLVNDSEVGLLNYFTGLSLKVKFKIQIIQRCQS